MKSGDIPSLPIADEASRAAAGRALVEVARNDPDVWVLTADVMHSTGVEPFALAFPDRFINVGIAEQTMMGVAAGLSTCGKIPFAATFAFLASMRACEQIRTDIAYPNLKVVIYATHSGIALAKGGTTHHATEDVAIMRSIANMTVVVPADARVIPRAIAAAVSRPGPVYLRLRRGRDPIVYPEEFDFRIGHACVLRPGSDVALISFGRTLAECIVASELLASQAISARVIDMHTVKPIDVETIRDSCSDTRMILTVEDHNVVGGLGGAVAEVMAELGTSTPLKRLGFPDVFAGIGPEDELLDKHGLSGPRIAGEVLNSLV